MAGSFKLKQFHNLIVSSGLFPKKTLEEFRLIHHLSYPEGEYFNEHIDNTFCSVKCTSFDEDVRMIQDLGRNCKLFKMDLKYAFRLLPMEKQDFKLLSIKFSETYYFDKVLHFGAAVSCKTFEFFPYF